MGALPSAGAAAHAFHRQAPQQQCQHPVINPACLQPLQHPAMPCPAGTAGHAFHRPPTTDAAATVPASRDKPRMPAGTAASGNALPSVVTGDTSSACRPYRHRSKGQHPISPACLRAPQHPAMPAQRGIAAYIFRMPVDGGIRRCPVQRSDGGTSSACRPIGIAATGIHPRDKPCIPADKCCPTWRHHAHGLAPWHPCALYIPAKPPKPAYPVCTG